MKVAEFKIEFPDGFMTQERQLAFMDWMDSLIEIAVLGGLPLVVKFDGVIYFNGKDVIRVDDNRGPVN